MRHIDDDVQMTSCKTSRNRNHVECFANLTGNFDRETHLIEGQFHRAMSSDRGAMFSKLWSRWLYARLATLNITAWIVLGPRAVGVYCEEIDGHEPAMDEWCRQRPYGTVLRRSAYGCSYCCRYAISKSPLVR